MTYLLRGLAILGLGIYSAAGLHYYSILISRTRNTFIRMFFPLVAVALFIMGPMFAAFWIAPPASVVPSRWRGRLGLLIIFLWIGPVYVYIAKNWRVLNGRSRPPKN